MPLNYDDHAQLDITDDDLQAKFFRRREACLRRREPELWRRYREWELSEAGTWWHMSLA